MGFLLDALVEAHTISPLRLGLAALLRLFLLTNPYVLFSESTDNEQIT